MVDCIGIANELKVALKDSTEAWQLLPGVANPVLGQEDGKKLSDEK